MTLEILKAMIKEEWRLHTSLFGSRMFALFPLLIGMSAFIISLFLPYMTKVMTIGQMLQSAHYLFIFFGVSIGAFGLFGREVMNRRFGQASLIAYSSRSLPISERIIFLNFHPFLHTAVDSTNNPWIYTCHAIYLNRHNICAFRLCNINTLIPYRIIISILSFNTICTFKQIAYRLTSSNYDIYDNTHQTSNH